MALLVKKIQASTLIEVITAMIIIMIIFGIAMMIFTNINTTSNTKLKLFAGMHIDKVYEETIKENSFFDEDYQVESIKIEKKIMPYKNNDNIIILQFIAFDNKGKELLNKKELVRSGTL